jgi:hypothetical protein
MLKKLSQRYHKTEDENMKVLLMLMLTVKKQKCVDRDFKEQN